MMTQVSSALVVALQGDSGHDVMFEDLEPGLLQHFSCRLACVKSKMGSVQDPRVLVVPPAAEKAKADAPMSHVGEVHKGATGRAKQGSEPPKRCHGIVEVLEDVA